MGGPGGPPDVDEFSKILQKFSEEKCNKCIMLAYFKQNFTNPALSFRAFGQKIQFLGNFEKILKSFLKDIVINALFLHVLHKSLQTLL